MTRETKIGLLVGLAFIIVIGILLSDHLTSSTEPPPATMSQAGSSVRSAITTPVRQIQQPVAEVVAPQVQPNQQVPTANDLVPRPQPVRIVQVDTPQNEPVTIQANDTQGIAQDQSQQQSPVTLTQRPANTVHEQPGQFERNIQQQLNPQHTAGQSAVQPQGTPPQQAIAQTPRSNDPLLTKLNQEAQRFGETIVPTGPQRPAQSSAFVATKYKAEPGDTLSKIATKMYGTSTKALREAIVEANPSLKENPNLVIEGRAYVIPAVAANANPTNRTVPAATELFGQTPVVQQSAPVKQSIQPPAVQKESGATYVVAEGDNLTRIAIDQCGDENALAAIKELNRDQLNGGDLIRPGMKLRLPAKSVAVNN